MTKDIPQNVDEFINGWICTQCDIWNGDKQVNCTKCGRRDWRIGIKNYLSDRAQYWRDWNRALGGSS